MRPRTAEAGPTRRLWAVPLAALALVLGLLVDQPQVLRGLRNAAFDQYQRWSPRPYDDAPVRIVDIDDESLRRLGQFPWPRDRVARLVDEIERLQPASVGLDIMFPEADRNGAEAHGLTPDAQLARALERGNVAIGFALKPEAAASAADAELQLKASVLARGGDPAPFLPGFSSSVASLPALQAAAAGQGAMTFVPDDDGIVRQVPLLMSLGGRLVPSLTAESLRLATHAGAYVVDSADNGGGVIDVRVGERVLPTDASGQMWVHYSAPHPERYIPAWQILERQVPADRVRGRIVLVGTSAQGLMDLRFSPRGSIIPGVEVHAQALEQVLSGQRLSRPGWAPALEIIATLLGAVAVGAIAMTCSAVLSTTAFVGIAAALCVAAWAAFVRGHVLLDPVAPTLALACVFLPTTVVRHVISERQQRWMKQAFARYVSPNLVEYLVAHPEALELGGKRQRCSFVFADLAGFTTLMEKMDPAAAVSVLNGYLDRMIAIAFEHDGTLDRIVGDAVAIVFSAPIEQVDHEQRALRCALQMHAFARRYVDDLARRGIPFCETRIGVHTGEVTVGNFGGGAIFDYRALGDPVNTAARLEGANKHLGTLICVSDETLRACPGAPARPIGRVRVVGRSEYLMVHEPCADAGGLDAEYQRAYELMRAEDETALAAFESLAAARPQDPLVVLHLRRLRAGERGDAIELSSK